MKRTVDVVAVFIFLIAIISIFFLREGVNIVGPTGSVVEDAIMPSEQPEKTYFVEKKVFPNSQYNLRFCTENSDGTVSVGITNKKDANELIERILLTNGFDPSIGAEIKYTCEKGAVLKNIVQEKY